MANPTTKKKKTEPGVLQSLKDKVSEWLSPIEPRSGTGIGSRRINRQIDPETGEVYNTINTNGQK